MHNCDGARTYLVECYWPGVTPERLRAAEARARVVTAELGSAGREVAFIGSVLVPADETVFCFFAGTEPDVREASERAHIPFERVLEAAPVAAGAHVPEVQWELPLSSRERGGGR